MNYLGVAVRSRPDLSHRGVQAAGPARRSVWSAPSLECRALPARRFSSPHPGGLSSMSLSTPADSRRLFLLSLALAPIAVLAGCGGGGGETAAQPEIANKKLKVMEDIKKKGDAAL